MRVAAITAVAALYGAAAPADDASDTVVITATRVPESSVDMPLSIDRLTPNEIRSGQLQVNLSESLGAVPGVSAQNRQNYAQDLQLSVRGFGARSSFGVRGVRLYADGIPGTMPDGQGQFSHFDLGSAERIEVLRGPFSSLYGNSSGGVIAIYTADAPAAAQISATAESGSLGTRRYALQGSGRPGGANLLVSASRFTTDGYRVHSAAERNTFNAKARWQLDGKSSLTLVANAVDTPEAQDPLGLTRAQLAADPRQAGSNALAYNTRKSIRQSQAGATYQRTLNAHDNLTAMAYGGHRATTQFQAILQAIEAARPTHPGGVIDLGRNYWGADLHLTDQRSIAGRPLQLTGGISYDQLDEARKGFLNFAGGQLGVKGALRRDEHNRVYDLDEYLQLQWDPAERWRAMAGARNSLVQVESHDHLPAAANAGTSTVRYSAFNPVAGLTYRAGATVNLYGAYGKGFETPTLNDLAYRSTDGSLPGLNIGLRPARSDNYELGIKTVTTPLRATLAGFYIDTRDELAVQSSSGGRTVFRNISATRRKGAELELQASMPRGFDSRLAYTHIEAVIPGGRRLPAVPANTLYAALSWRRKSGDFSVTLESLGRSRIYVDDLNSDAAAGYWLANLHFELNQERHAWHCTEALRFDNLFDRRYVGSVIVNESNSRYFEPAPGRSVYLMLTLRHQ